MDWAVSTIGAVEAIGASALPQAPRAADAATPFVKLMDTGVGDLNATLGAAEAAMRDFSLGKPVELHEVMVKLENARIGVQTFVQVRNKLIESYQDLMRMQL